MMPNFNQISQNIEVGANFRPTNRMTTMLASASLLTLAALTGLSAPSSALAQTVNGVTYAPTVLTPQSKGFVSIALQNNTNAKQAARVVTFGHVFAPGAVPAGSGLTATAAGVSVPLAMTVKATHPDGSVRHAIISLSAPAVAAGAQTFVNFALGKAAPATAAIKAADIVRPGWAPEAVFTFTSPTATTVSVNISSLVTKAITDGTAQVWLNNSLVKEVRVSTKLNAQMTATFDIRVSSDGQIKTDMIVANDEAFTVTQGFVYSVAVTNKGTTLYEQKNLSQYPYSNWHCAMWTGTTQSPLNVAFDPENMAKSGAVAEFDFSLGVDANTLTADNAALASAASGPMQSSLITTYMGTTGGRPDIGLVTAWAANYLVSQDQGAKTVMMAQADAGGSVPWHLRDAATNTSLSIALHPTTWADYRDGSNVGTTPGDLLASPFDITAAANQDGWELDQSHEPDLAFVPYLITGDHYYLDELESEASFLTLSGNPGYRLNGQALIQPWNQVRGVAWNLRDIGNAAWIAPDADPLKPAYAAVVASNVTNLQSIAAQVSASEGQIAGILPSSTNPSMTAPWQNDFVQMELDALARRGITSALPVENWLNQFNAGLYTNGANGYNPLNGSGYWFNLPVTTAGTNDYMPTSYAQLYTGNFAGQPAPTVMANFPTCTFCYPAYSTMAMAETFSTTQSPASIWAYAYLVANTPVLQQSGYVSDPSWHVTPVMPDGYHLRNADIQIIPDSSGTASITSAHGVIAGGAGTNVLNGGTGYSVLYAGTGTATINVGSGTSWVIAGAGESLGSPTTVTVNAAVAATETIMDFNPSFDRLRINNAAHANVLPTIGSDANGNAVLTLAPNHVVTLLGVPASAVNSSWVSVL
jgi:hypothetical protein